jgi:hypothetical protein
MCPAALYTAAARKLAQLAPYIQLRVFSDRDIASRRPEVAAALAGADAFFGSLLFDYDTVEWLRGQLAGVPVVLVFESALELMGQTRIGSFTMDPSGVWGGGGMECDTEFVCRSARVCVCGGGLGHREGGLRMCVWGGGASNMHASSSCVCVWGGDGCEGCGKSFSQAMPCTNSACSPNPAPPTPPSSPLPP